MPFEMQQTHIRTKRSELRSGCDQSEGKGGRTSRTINALSVDAIERGAGRVVAVGAATRRANRDASAIEDADGLSVGVGTSMGDSHDGSEDESNAKSVHGGQVQERVKERQKGGKVSVRVAQSEISVSAQVSFTLHSTSFST